MSIHKSLVPQSKLRRHRNVLSRSERLEILQKEDRWDESKSVFGLVKVRNILMKAKPKKKEEAAVEGVAAVPGAAPAAGAAAPAAGAKGAAPAAGAKGAAPAAGAKGAAPAAGAKGAAPAAGAKAAAPAPGKDKKK